MFGKAPAAGARLVLLVLIALALVIADVKTSALHGLREAGAAIASPFYWFSRQPGDLVGGIRTYFSSREHLLLENERLHSDARVLRGELQQMVSLTAENVRLKELLSSTTVVEDSVLVAETISVSPSPLQHKITINKGEHDGVYIGQAVIDAYGLVGQVVEVHAKSASVIQVSDARHAIPVQVNRNGVRGIVEGTGRVDRLSLPNMVETTDIKAGDLLVSSGLGQRFPVGYPVGVVESVESDPGEAFLRIVVRPSAKLDRGRYVLLVFAGETARAGGAR
ncbi:MAG: rod shape-determining protein MreC [Gammaproteobacteria bacterium]|nr:rod shape-determining protein MreC [Gammaproteobacteria bacterium]NND39156.1 rod shape-determining protein MreC [Pseudomonadales bacterium]NNL11078.1 rod shape-determining protein MreC [Pseudomonadales bacterium]NNM12541.1 rod shape-determining protein MreC [Pseudomonadales bacterium]RZV58511.1 MAG: rod shape-determining protein MreC [Pseudomonadales bacterium]